jgi:deoxyribodipyrimidine photo-lyase
MSRDQRSRDNWALLYAQEKAQELAAPLLVVFALASTFEGATLRQYDFMLQGLEEVEADLRSLNIPFFLLPGEPAEQVVGFVQEKKAGLLVTDFDPLHVKRCWVHDILKKTVRTFPVHEVDAHNIVPARIVSQKVEVGARTLRPKIHRLLGAFLTPFPVLSPLPEKALPHRIDWVKARASLSVDEAVAPVKIFSSGMTGGENMLRSFLQERLRGYADKRNDPNAGVLSGLSPYFHFGQLAPQRAALEALKKGRFDDADIGSFLEEMIIRRELSDNFCLYNQRYNSLEGIADWAFRSLDEHKDDPRPYIYSLKEFEAARTHSALWNAAQNELLQTGKMHGYMRMFWAKKILEWSSEPQTAFEIALYLNDRYSLDGRDPNGYVGVLWSIGGVHDRGWKERAVYGKIRYMNENGCRRKFDVPRYISRWNGRTNME